MASSPLISCPKKVTQDVDWAVPIRQIIATTYGESPDAYVNECAALNRCRQDALRGSAGSEVTARDLLYKYFGQLELLELRFPEIRVPFPWSDAFTTKAISQLSLAYEKASVIFNIAATLSALASAQNRSSPEGLKRAFNGFRAAAGMFQYINDNFLHAPSTDLSRDVVKNLVILMSAQATEVFLERMIEERKGPGIKSRVCAQAASMYHSLQDEIKDFVVKGWFSRAWSLLIQCKSAYFASLAQYNRSLADASASKHGEALARLKVAEKESKDAQRFANAFTNVFLPASVPTLPADAATSMVELCKTHVHLVAQAKVSGQSDNDLIYHETIPSEASLTPVEKAIVAEPVPIQETYGTPEVQKVVGADIFNRLVPLSVHESASLYSEEKAKLVRAQTEACELADTEMKAALEYLGLPASLAKFKGISALNDFSEPGSAVRQWTEAITRAEAEKPIQRLLDALDGLKSRARSDIDAAQQDLDVEQHECEAARVRYATFTQSPSAVLAKTWRQALRGYREQLDQAAVSDARNKAEWMSVQADVGLLIDKGAVEHLYAEAVADAGAKGAASLLDDEPSEDHSEDLSGQTLAIEEALGRLNKIKRERSEALKDLKERVQNDDISQILLLNRKNPNVEPQLFAAELEKFRPNQNRIAAASHHQQMALSEIGNRFKVLTEGSVAKDIQAKWHRAETKRRDLSARLQRAHDGYVDVRVTLEKGAAFYKGIGELASNSRNEVSHFVSDRGVERRRLISDAEIDQQLGSPAIDNSSTTIDHCLDSLNLGSTRRPERFSTTTPPAPYPSLPLPNALDPNTQRYLSATPALHFYSQPATSSVAYQPLANSPPYPSPNFYPAAPSSAQPVYSSASHHAAPLLHANGSHALSAVPGSASTKRGSLPPPPTPLSYAGSYTRSAPPPPESANYAFPAPAAPAPPKHLQDRGYTAYQAQQHYSAPPAQPHHTTAAGQPHLAGLAGSNQYRPSSRAPPPSRPFQGHYQYPEQPPHPDSY